MDFVLGNVVKTPELRKVNVGDEQVSALDVTLAENYAFGKDKEGNRTQKTRYVRFTLWRKHAEAMAPYVVKGRLMAANGYILPDSFVGEEGVLLQQLRLDMPTDVRLLGSNRPKETAEPQVDLEKLAQLLAEKTGKKPF